MDDETIKGRVRKGYSERARRAKQDPGERPSATPPAGGDASFLQAPLLLRRVEPRTPPAAPSAGILFTTPEQDAARFQLQLRGLSPDQGHSNPQDDALARTARGAPLAFGQDPPQLGQTLETVRRWRQEAQNAVGINGRGYMPAAGDELLLARAIFAETGSIPGDVEALGWAIVNRIGSREYGRTLYDVLHQHNQYQFLHAGGDPDPRGSLQWRLSANPGQMDPVARASWLRALETSRRILSGSTSDPTGGATHFFAHDGYGPGRPAPLDFFQQRIAEGRFTPSPYVSRATGRTRNCFFVDRGSRR